MPDWAVVIVAWYLMPFLAGTVLAVLARLLKPKASHETTVVLAASGLLIGIPWGLAAIAVSTAFTLGSLLGASELLAVFSVAFYLAVGLVLAFRPAAVGVPMLRLFTPENRVLLTSDPARRAWLAAGRALGVWILLGLAAFATFLAVSGAHTPN